MPGSAAGKLAPGRCRLTRQQIRGLITAVDDLRAAIRRAEAKPAKTALYQQLRVRLTYDPGNNSVRAEADLGPDAVGNGLCPRPDLNPNYMILLREELELSR